MEKFTPKQQPTRINRGPAVPERGKRWMVSFAVFIVANAVLAGLIYLLNAIFTPHSDDYVVWWPPSFLVVYGLFWLCCVRVLKPLGYYDSDWTHTSYATNVSMHNNMVNGVGTTTYGCFGERDGFFRGYQFLCFFYVPILPLDCIVKSPDISTGGDTSSCKVLGRSGWHLLELAVIMGRGLAIIALVCSGFMLWHLIF